MKTFHHVNAFTIEEAVNTLQEHKGKAKIIAGGTDIVGVLKDQILPVYPEALLNIKTISSLDYIREDDKGLKIGSLAKLSALAKSPPVKEKYRALAEAAQSVATPQIRNMATVGGNLGQDTRCWYYRYPHSIGGRLLCPRKGSGPCLAVNGDNRYHAIFDGRKCFAACPSDLAVALLLLDAEIEAIGAGGTRTISLQDFFNPLGNALEPGEIITGIRVPKPPAQARQQYLKFTLRKPVDFAVVSVAVLLVTEGELCSEARIVLGAVAPGPLRRPEAEKALQGRKLDETVLREAAELAVKGAKPLSKNAYKIEITKTLVHRGTVLLCCSNKE